ncbi:hypothetical protein D3C79_585780 [compost metagenome]
MGAGQGGDGPGVAPAVAVEHRQGPQVHRVVAHGPGHLVAQGVEVGAAVVIDHAFGIAGGAGGVVQRDGLPLVLGPLPGELGVAFGEKGLVVQVADRLTLAVFRIIDIDHQRRVFHQRQRCADDLVEFAVGDQHLGFTVFEHERNGLGVQAHVEGIEHGANHRHTEVCFEHCRNVRQHHGYRVALPDTASGQGAGQASGAFVGLLPVAPDGTMNHRRVLAIDRRRAFDETQGAQGLVIDRGGRQALGEDRHELFLCRGRPYGVLQPPVADC